MKKLLLALVFVFVMTACSGTSSELANNATQLPTPNKNGKGWEATATVASFRTRENGGIRFMTFNIFFGGYGQYGDSKTHDILLSVIKDYDPDVLGIQEANGWDANDFAIPKWFANQLEMNYLYCKSLDNSKDDQTFDTIIFTKYEILDSENFPAIKHCMGRVNIQIPAGDTIQVFNLHTPHQHCHELFPKIIEITKPYMNQHAVMMGDFNVVDPFYAKSGENFHNAMVGCPELLEESGWVWLEASRLMGAIDQIWVTSPMKDFDYVTRMHRTEFLAPQKNINLVSDHNPTAADIYFP